MLYKGIGDIRLRTEDGAIKIITQVRYIPDIKRNLISLGMLEIKGFKFSSENGCMTVSKNGVVMMNAEKRNSLYYLIAETVVGSSNVAFKSDLVLWHRRLGHIGKSGLMQLVKKGVVVADQATRPHNCEFCILGKSKKQPFEVGKHNSKAILDYAHSDLWGPARPSTIGGGR